MNTYMNLIARLNNRLAAIRKPDHSGFSWAGQTIIKAFGVTTLSLLLVMLFISTPTPVQQHWSVAIATPGMAAVMSKMVVMDMIQAWRLMITITLRDRL